MESKSKSRRQSQRYKRVQVTDLNRGRRGKHHELIQGILEELRGLKAGAALAIPLSDAGGVELANLRSAVHRASSAAGIVIETLSDEEHFYVWNKAWNKASPGVRRLHPAKD